MVGCFVFCIYENNQEQEIIRYLHSRYYRISTLKVFCNITWIKVTKKIQVPSSEYPKGYY